VPYGELLLTVLRVLLSLIGAFSLVGVVGALAVQRVGMFFDRGLFIPALGIGLAVTIAGLVVSAFGSTSIVVLTIGAVVFGIGLQTVQHLLTQTQLPGHRLDRPARIDDKAGSLPPILRSEFTSCRAYKNTFPWLLQVSTNGTAPGFVDSLT
jgi:CBS-domain-containing membrane protein